MTRPAADRATVPVTAGGAAEPVTVVKLGGETLAEQHATLEGIAQVARTRAIVLVHGGGKRVSAWLDRLGIESTFVEGRRATDDRALEVAVAVLRGLINAELVAALRDEGADSVGISGLDGGLLRTARVPGLGRVGRVVRADTTLVDDLVRAGRVPVVAPIAPDETGAICNVNADEVAAGLASALRGRLVMLSDVEGVRGPDGTTIRSLDPARAEKLIEAGVIADGMIPKVRAALEVLSAGGREVVIADGRDREALPRALDDPAYGTTIVAGGAGKGADGSALTRGR